MTIHKLAKATLIGVLFLTAIPNALLLADFMQHKGFGNDATVICCSLQGIIHFGLALRVFIVFSNIKC
jgi:hypothetical protein